MRTALIAKATTLTTSSPIDTGLGNAEGLLLKVLGLVLLIAGVSIVLASKKDRFGKVAGQLAIIVCGLIVVLLGVGAAGLGTTVGRNLLGEVFGI